MIKSYIDIGHGMHAFHSVLWVYDGGIKTHSATKTHEKVWGKRVAKLWRGRYDKEENILSVMPPMSHKTGTRPKYLRDALEAKFGDCILAVNFKNAHR